MTGEASMKRTADPPDIAERGAPRHDPAEGAGQPDERRKGVPRNLERAHRSVTPPSEAPEGAPRSGSV